MKLIVLLSLALALAIGLIAFPNLADQMLRIEAFGWILETRQGVFLITLFALLLLVWLTQRLLGALVAGPGNVWRSLRMGNRKRREKRLREALAQWVDSRGDFGEKTLKRSRGVLPDWALEMLRIMVTQAKDQKLPQSADDSLLLAYTARVATEPGVHPQPDLATRKAFLEAWLKAHPGAPLAMNRLAAIAEEEGDWHRLVTLLEEVWKNGHRSSHSVKPRLAHAYLALAGESPEQRMEYLRKAFRLFPEDQDVLIAYGRALAESGDEKGASRLWTEHLEKQSHIEVAKALLELVRDNALRTYRKLENRAESELNEAQRWLRAELAHTARLDGLAYEQMRSLAEQPEYAALAWQSMGNWHTAAKEFEQAAHCFRQALQQQS